MIVIRVRKFHNVGQSFPLYVHTYLHGPGVAIQGLHEDKQTADHKTQQPKFFSAQELFSKSKGVVGSRQ